MAFWGDYHTHTVYSHGRGTVEENVLAARARGLKAIALTDHGISGYPQNLHPADLPAFLSDVKASREAHPDVTVLAGIEANLVSLKGDLDLTEEWQDKLDLIICGFHGIRVPDSLSGILNFWLPNLFPTKNLRRRVMKNTDAYINAMRRFRVSIISHPLREIPCDLRVLGEAAKEYGVYIELNSKKCLFTPKDFEVLANTGCRFICDSDAHEPERVGDFSAVELFEAAGLDKSLIANWEAFPTFR
ncbi:MAG: PHP domain-containing protein [Clostridia bacterium]|nr:PHP domain-containing protein [Clostridia bacterium]